MPQVAPHRLERRKQVRLRARPNLNILSRFQAGRRVHVVKDPVSLQYFHLEEAQRFALQRMDGRHTLEQIQQAYEREFRPQRLSLEELEGFASHMLQLGLVVNEAPGEGQRVLERMDKQLRQRQWLKLANLFYFKIPLLQPSRWLDRLIPLGRMVFHPLVVLGVLVFLLVGVGLILTRWNAFVDRLPGLQDLFSWSNVAYLWLAMGLVKMVHELGHGLCARTLGGEVHDFGAAFMFFMPTLYCNVSDAWMLPQKWKRMAIGAAGIYMELLMAGCAVWLWWATAPESMVHQFSFWVIVTCSVHTLVFNANPLMRFDGYFLLSDWLDIPNLYQVAHRAFRSGLQQWIGYAPSAPAPGPGRFLFFYGMACCAYRLLVVACTLYLFQQFMKELRLEWLGLALVLLALIAMASWPVYRFWQSLGQLRKVSPMKPRRFWLSMALGGSLVAVFFLVPFPHNVRGLGLVQVESGRQHSLLIPAPGGFLVQTFVRDGQVVQKGDVLALLRNPQIDLELRLTEADQALRAEQLKALTGQLATQNDSEATGDGRSEIQQEMHSLAHQHAALKARAGEMVVRAPCSGTLMGFPGWDVLGKWLPEGTPLCQIGDESQLRVLILLEPADRQLLDVGNPIRFRCHGMSHLTWRGEITNVAQVDAQDIPVQLSHRLGGEIVSKQDPVQKTEKPDHQHYLISAKLGDVHQRLQVGTLGQVRIEAGSQTWWGRVRRYLGATFQVGL